MLLAWPEGLAYGRVPAERLGELVDARRHGRVVPDLLRGRVHQSEPEQAAELPLRSVLGLAALDAVRPAAPPTTVPAAGDCVKIYGGAWSVVAPRSWTSANSRPLTAAAPPTALVKYTAYS